MGAKVFLHFLIKFSKHVECFIWVFTYFLDGARTLFAGVTMTATRGLLITIGQVRKHNHKLFWIDHLRLKHIFCLKIRNGVKQRCFICISVAPLSLLASLETSSRL